MGKLFFARTERPLLAADLGLNYEGCEKIFKTHPLLSPSLRHRFRDAARRGTGEPILERENSLSPRLDSMIATSTLLRVKLLYLISAPVST